MNAQELDELGVRCKAFEAATTAARAPRNAPLLVRLDGRAFHTYTSGLRRPYDERLSRCMVETTRTLVEKMHPAVGYTQSDEITLLFAADADNDESDLPFGGRFMKIATVLAGMASARFAVLAEELIEERRGRLPHFDGRAWSVPTEADAVDAFRWRLGDARKNAASAAAQARFSHRELLGVGTSEKLRRLAAEGVDFKAYPTFFRAGVFLVRVVVEVALDEAERLRIPMRHRPQPGTLVKRGRVVEVDPPAELGWTWLTQWRRKDAR